MLNKKILFGFGSAGLLVLSGCKSFNDYQEERIAYAVKHFERARLTNLKQDQILTLNDCVRLAVANNLDLKVFGLEEQVAKEMRTSEMLGMFRNARNAAGTEHLEQFHRTHQYSGVQQQTA